MNMVSDERDIEEDGEPFTSKEEDEIEEKMNKILGENERIQSVALVDWILEISLEFIKSNHMKHCKEDEEGI